MQSFKMQPFTKLDGVAVALRRDNVDSSATRCSATCGSMRTASHARIFRSMIRRARARAC